MIPALKRVNRCVVEKKKEMFVLREDGGEGGGGRGRGGGGR